VPALELPELPMPINAKLVVVGGDVKTAEIKLRLPSTVGRGRGTTIMLPHPLVSRQHCELFESNGQLMVRDLGSLNGTFVNNQRITESPLPPGELLTIGTVTFRAMYEANPDSQPPSGAGPQLKPKRSETEAPLPAANDVDFEFDEPAIPVDEDAAPAVAHGTRKMETTLEDYPGKTNFTAAAKTSPAPPAKGAPAAPAPAKPAASPDKPAADKGEPAGDFSKWKEDAEDDEPMKVDEDDDLGEFLKRLGK
jgi:pSer/pThr/pTyr-binding forkhead associated (FHA) protein